MKEGTKEGMHVCVCMYVTYVCMHAQMYTCMDVQMYRCIDLKRHLCVHVCLDLYIHVTCICTSVYVHTHR